MKKILTTLLMLSLSACSGFFAPDSDNYWRNTFRSYRTYPITYYDEANLPNPEKLTDKQTIATHTFKRNTVVSANVGQRMVDSETYTIKKYSHEKLIANATGTIANASTSIKLVKGEAYQPIGEIKRNGEKYLLFEPDHNGNYLLVSPNGKLLPKIAMLYKGELFYPKADAEIDPHGLGIEPITNERKDIAEPQQRFEIKYDGSEDGFMSFLYAKYNSKGVPDVKRYIYSVEDVLLDIDGVKLQITDVLPDRIEYMILD